MNWKQASVSALLVVSALSVVWSRLLVSGSAPAQQGAEGHDHAAMATGGEQRPVSLSPGDARRIGVTFARVERRALDRSIETLGTVAYDETRLTTVNPKVDGWVEELFVDFTGAPVREGQPLMSVYSPRLVSAQEELVLAARLLERAAGGRSAENARELLESARRRLEYWDVPEDEIRRIEETGQMTKALTLRAPASGVVVEKNVVAGDQIMPGMTVYRIADLSRVWIEADVFEKDLGLVREGQGATVAFEAFPARTFAARVTYVYPTVSIESRTGRIRLELPNREGLLKPGMFARIMLDVPPSAPTLVVPRSAVLSTGARSLAFVRADDRSLVPRVVTPGRTVGREVEILAGLEVGEHVVSSAAFLVDAESNLGALTAGMRSTEVGSGAMDAGHDTSGMQPPAGSDTDHSGHGTMTPDTASAAHSGHGVGAAGPSTR